MHLFAMIDVQEQVDIGLSAINEIANSRQYELATQFLGLVLFAFVLIKVFRKLF